MRVTHHGANNPKKLWRRGSLAATAALLFLGAVALLGWAGWQFWEATSPPPEPKAAYTLAPDAVPTDAGTPPPVALPPHTLAIPSLSVTMPLDVMGVEDGELQLPPPQRATLYDQGAEPGDAAGTVLLAGHVNSRSEGRGALFSLATIEQGARVWVTDADGWGHEYVVVALTLTKKSALPQDVFSADGAPRLVVVTCGGRVIQTDRGRVYESNVVAEARPTGARTPPVHP